MTDETCRPWRELLGAYAVGHLSEADHAAVETHLGACADCRAELGEIRSVLPALEGIEPDRMSVLPVPSEDLGDRIFSAVAQERRGRHRQQLARSLAAAAVVIGIVAVGSLLRPSAPEVPLEQVAVRVTNPAVEADATLIAHTWGTELILAAEGLQQGGTFVLAFQRADGSSVDGGTFLGVGDKPLTCRMNAAVMRDDVVGFVVRDGRGRVVIEADLPSAPPRA